MAIAFDAATNSRSTSSASLTYSHTTSGSNRALIVSCGVINPSGNTITGVTYNGVAMTALLSPIVLQANIRMYFFYLLNPASGTNNVVVTANSSADVIDGASASYTGVSQSGFPDASGSSGVQTTATITQAVTTIADNCWLVGAGWGNTAVGAGTGTTERSKTSDNRCGIFDSNGAKTPPGSFSLQVTNSSADNGGLIVASLAPYVATGPVGVKTVDGVTAI